MNAHTNHQSDRAFVKGYLAYKAGVQYKKHSSRAYKAGWWQAYADHHRSSK